jgi:hypothetical protein
MAQLRIVTYNITDYAGGFSSQLQTVFYGVYNGRSLAPDVICAQEFTSASALTQFVSILNSAPGSPGDWKAAPFVDGPDTESVFVYRQTKVQYLGMTIVSNGGTNQNQPPRNTYRYDIRPMGYSSAATTLAIYVPHMKAGATDTDRNRRLIEAQRIRANAESLPSGWNFVVAGDFNIQTSNEPAYIEMVEAKVNDLGRVFDPIATPGNWNNNSAFRFVHTQDPATQMDDRFDQILFSASLLNASACDYIGNPSLPYSTTTWNDPNHSYRAWGNDGTSYDMPLRTSGNSMVGPTIAQAIIDLAQGLGHIPVYADLKVPAKIGTTDVVDFGLIAQGASVQKTLTVTNVADTTLWTAAGIDDLSYSLSTSPPFGVPNGNFSEPAGGGSNQHTVTLDTSKPGRYERAIVVVSDDPDQPIRTIVVRAKIVGKIGL